jgi:hypothetical protein
MGHSSSVPPGSTIQLLFHSIPVYISIDVYSRLIKLNRHTVCVLEQIQLD